MDSKETALKGLAGKVQYRLATLERSAVDPEARTAQLSFSSEAPYERFFGVEILDHSPQSVDMSRLADGAPFLFQHDPDRLVGTVLSARIDADRVGRAEVKLSRNDLAQEVLNDMVDGIRTKVSVGYIVNDMVQEGKNDSGIPVFRVTAWTPLEISTVSIPADNSVGLGRSAEVAKGDNAGNVPAENADETEPTISIKKGPKQMDEKEILQNERKRVAAIEATAARFANRVNLAGLMKTAINDGWDSARFDSAVLDEVAKTPTPAPAAELGLSNREKAQYSFHRAIMSQVPGSGIDASFEKEVSDQVAKKIGQAPRGLYVPYDVQRRDMTVGTDADGGYLVATDQSGFIELLRAKLVASQLGVTFLPGLVGDVAIPKQTGAVTAYWVAEDGAPTETTASLGQVTLSPKTMAGWVDFSRKLMLQSVPGVEGLIRNDLAAQLARALDTAIFHGTGTSNQPTGIVPTAAITSASRATFSHTGSTDLLGYVIDGNFISDNMNFVTTPTLYAALMSREKAANQAIYLIEDGMMLGYPVVPTNAVSSGFLFFGDFSQILVGEWGGLDILVNPYTLQTTGQIRVTAFQSVDIAIRHTDAFSYAYNVS